MKLKNSLNKNLILLSILLLVAININAQDTTGIKKDSLLLSSYSTISELGDTA